MRVFPYNDKLFHENEFGSFTVVSKNIFNELKKLDLIGDPINPNTIWIQPECLDARRKSQNFIPYLACEYSKAANSTIENIKQYNPFILTISEFARKNILNSLNYDESKIKTVHLGSSPEIWYKTDDVKFKTFTYLTVNTSNDRSGFEYLIPAFINFSKDKNVRLIIKDGHKNYELKNYLKQLNNEKIIYNDDKLSQPDLRKLYNKSHVFVYATNTTSFGMNIMDCALCGTPVIATYGSAIKEFLPDWTQPVKITSKKHNFENSIIAKMINIGIPQQCLPNKIYYPEGTQGEIVDENSILESLNYSFDNYKHLQEINSTHMCHILNNFSWKNTVEQIVKSISYFYGY